MKQRTTWTMPIVTIIAVAAAIVLAFIGSGALGGTAVSEAAGGALSADATPLAPGGPAFSMWSVIYVGLAVYAVYQLLPAQRASARHARLRPWAALSALLNAGWLAVIQADSIWGSVLVIVVLLLVLIKILLILRSESPTSVLDTIITDGTFGLYLGWVAVATAANISALIASFGIDLFSGWEWAAAGVLAVVAAIGAALAVYTRGRIAPALAMSWGLGWIAAARTSGDFESGIIIAAAAGASAIVLVTAIVQRMSAGR